MSSATGVKAAKTADSQTSGHADNSAVYMLRTAQQHHVHLSAMADHKASILLGAASVVLTILFGQLQSGGLTLPVGILSLFALISAFFSVMAVMPRTGSSTRRAGEPRNLLFFGAFADLSTEEYLAEMERVTSSGREIHRMMTLDIYQMGKVLNDRKFRYLAYSYRLFLIGLIATFAVTIVSAGLKLMRS